MPRIKELFLAYLVGDEDNKKKQYFNIIMPLDKVIYRVYFVRLALAQKQPSQTPLFSFNYFLLYFKLK
jgi:hypothetical protein